MEHASLGLSVFLVSEYINMCIVKSVSIKSGLNTVLMMSWEWRLAKSAHICKGREHERDIYTVKAADTVLESTVDVFNFHFSLTDILSTVLLPGN